MGGSYTVREGDTLSSIASMLWGDSSLWYKIAEANGLAGEVGLFEGQVLALPTGVIKNTHNASTFSPYEASEIIGDTGPSVPRAKKKNKCGGVGAILLAVVAVVVTVWTAGAAAGAMGAIANGTSVLGGALAGEFHAMPPGM